MAKSRRVFVCRECGAEFPSWTGQCSSCRAWASVAEVAEVVSSRVAGAATAPVATVPLAEVDVELALPVPVGVDEIDRVLGGGLTPGSVTLLAGEPGVGKSTVTLQIARSVAAGRASVLVVAGEEAPSQVAARAARIGDIPPTLLVIDDVTVDGVIAAMVQRQPQLVVVDSIQTMRNEALDASPGSVTQVKAVAGRLVEEAKRSGVSLILVGHVTKEGSIAGPRVLEHMVDTVLSFDGDANGDLRLLRAIKHRFGPTAEVGIFDMTGGGLVAVPDPSQRYLSDRQPDLAGSVVLATLAGRRPVLVEVQALALPTEDRSGRLTTQGVDGRRASLVSAVLASRAGYRTFGHDLFVSAAGGAFVDEPGSDLAVAMAMATAIDGRPIAPDVVVCGEIGLGGELRSSAQLEHRLQEAYRMGFRTAIVPRGTPEGPTGLTMIRNRTVAEALAAVPQSLSV